QPFFAYIPLNSSHHPLVVPEKYYQQYLGKPGISEQVAKFFGMNENVDSNFGALLKQLKDWGIESNTLVIYIGTDNGGTEGVKIFNAGMKGQKGSVNQGGTRAPAFFRWPAGGIPGGTECAALSAHLDIFPTLAEIAAVKSADDLMAAAARMHLQLGSPFCSVAFFADQKKSDTYGFYLYQGGLGQRQGRGIQIPKQRHSELALHAGEQQGAL
ncbi:MAG: sulfatase-like hydrolase/transferase, partial [Kiritimatiellaeota bacterium]|nr:sulfatase-like hydrolase/transferase [Kiritimatiellota bacterium]